MSSLKKTDFSLVTDNPFLKTTLLNSSMEEVYHETGSFSVLLNSEIHKAIYELGTEKVEEYINLQNNRKVEHEVSSALEQNYKKIFDRIVSSASKRKDSNFSILFLLEETTTIRDTIQIFDSDFNLDTRIPIDHADLITSDLRVYSYSRNPGTYYVKVSDSNYFQPINILVSHRHFVVFKINGNYVDPHFCLRFNCLETIDIDAHYPDFLYSVLINNLDNKDFSIDYLLKNSFVVEHLNSFSKLNYLHAVCYRAAECKSFGKLEFLKLFVEQIAVEMQDAPDFQALTIWLTFHPKIKMKLNIAGGVGYCNRAPELSSSYRFLIEASTFEPLQGLFTSDTFRKETLRRQAYLLIQENQIVPWTNMPERDFSSLLHLLQKKIYNSFDSPEIIKKISSSHLNNETQRKLIRFLFQKPFSIYQWVVTNHSSQVKDDKFKELAIQLFDASKKDIHGFNAQLFQYILSRHETLALFPSLQEISTSTGTEEKLIMVKFWEEYDRIFNPLCIVNEFGSSIQIIAELINFVLRRIEHVQADLITAEFDWDDEEAIIKAENEAAACISQAAEIYSG